MNGDFQNDSSACCGKSRRGRPPQMPAPAREAAILRTTAQLLLEIPFDDVTMDVVSAKAGMSKRTIYEHFKSRDDLLIRAIIDISRTIFLPLSETDTKRPLRERLSLLLRLNVPPGREENKLECLRSIIAKAQTFPVLTQSLYDNGHGALLGFVRTELLRAMNNGEIGLPQAEVSMAAEMLLDMALENTLTRLLRPSAPPQSKDEVDRRREMAITIFLEGCRTPASAN